MHLYFTYVLYKYTTHTKYCRDMSQHGNINVYTCKIVIFFLAADSTRVFCSTVRPSRTKGTKQLEHVYQSAVLTGACTEGNPDCYDAPFNHRNPGDRFDSVTNQGTFVVFSRAQAYPKYLITFY